MELSACRDFRRGCVYPLEPSSCVSLCPFQSADLHGVGSLNLLWHSPWILANSAPKRLIRLPCGFFLTTETSPTNDEDEREKALPMQYKFSIPKEKVKREMKSFHGISD